MKRLTLACALLTAAGAMELAGCATAATPTASAAAAPAASGAPVATAASGAPAAAASSGTPSSLSNDDAKVGYSYGYLLGKSFVQNVPTLNTDTFSQGFHDAFSGKPGAISDDDMKATLTAYQEKLRDAAVAKQKQQAEDNGKKGDAYLAANAKKAGVKTTSSGLQYEVVKAGTGKTKPVPSDKVKVNYEGRLIDGTVFDSSAQRGEPASFELDQVIPGWTEALQLMTVGSKYRLTIPAALAYGEQGAGPIPPNSVLVFDVELLDIQKGGEAADPAASGK